MAFTLEELLALYPEDGKVENGEMSPLTDAEVTSVLLPSPYIGKTP
jgi:hypothetical protein